MEKYIVDLTRTKAYKDIYNEICTCSNCRNFRNALPIYAPKTDKVLKEMGLSVAKALEVIDSWDGENKLHSYEVFFSVAGSLLKDQTVISEDEGKITLFFKDSNMLMYGNTSMEEPCFVLELLIDLPWIIDDKEE